MASTIRIKRSSVNGNPSTLAAGELAYSSYNGAGGNRLYIGVGTETVGNAASHVVIGGQYYTGLIDASTAGTLTTNASSIPILSATGGIDQWLPGNLKLTGNTLSTTNSNGNLILAPNGTGAVSINNAWTLPTTTGTNTYVLTTNGAGAASWQPTAATLSLAAGGGTTSTVNLLNQTLTVAGGNGITTTVSGQTITISSIGAGGYSSTATGAGVTTLSASSPANQFFTGTTTQTVKLPDTSTLTVGQEYILTNNSTGNITVQTSAGGGLLVQLAGQQVTYTVSSISTQSWVYEYSGYNSVTGTGSVVLANSPTLVTPALGAATATSIVTSAGLVSSGMFSGTYSDGIILDYDSGNSNARISAGSGDSITFYNAADATRVQLLKIGSTGHITLEGVTSTGATGTGNFVFSSSPLLTTPTIGSAGANFSGSTSGTITLAATAIAGSNTLTLPAATDTLTNKTFDTAGAGNVFKINGTQITSNTGTGANVLAVAPTITGHPTIEGVTSTGATGTGNFVFSSSPTLVTPTLGVATATSINGLTISTTTGTLTLANGSTLVTSGAYSTTLTSTGLTNVTLPTTGTLATLSNSETLTNKTLSTGSTWNGNTVAVAYGGTGTTNGSITGTGALVFTAGGTNQNVDLVPSGTGTVDVASARITSLGTPTQATDAATKAYVDGLKSGLTVKFPARLATTGANLSVTASGSGAGKTLTNSGTQAALVIDSVPAVVGDRVLIKDQSTAKDNGIYVVTNIGSASTNWVLTRATDADGATTTGTMDPGAFIFVTEGTLNANSGYVIAEFSSDVATITVDTNPINFVQFSGAGEINAGSGLSKNGNTLSVNVDNATLSITGGNLQVNTGYVGQTSITTLGTITTGTWHGSVLGATYGGTGVNNGSNTITLGGNINTAGSFTTYGAFPIAITATANTGVTLPTTGTLATLANVETLTNKTLGSGSTWNGNTVSVGYGGTGITSATQYGIVYGNGSGPLQVTAAAAGGSGTDLSYQILTVNSSGVPMWSSSIDGGTY